MKKTTLRFYTDSGRYMGWEKADKYKICNYINWVRSGNTLKSGDGSMSTPQQVKLFFQGHNQHL